MKKEVDRQSTLTQRILDLYDDLSRMERRLADLLLKNPDAVVLHSASELSGLADVSKATTARFFQRLGYPSFKTAQKLAKSPIIQPTADAERIKRLGGVRNSVGEHLEQDMQNLVRTMEQLRQDKLSQAIAAMARAEKIWVVGFGDNYPLAHFARAQLIRVKPDIRMIPIGGFSIPEEFASIHPHDAVIGFDLAQHSRNLRSIMRSAVTAGSHTILITDAASGTRDDLAAATLRCRTRGTGVFESAVAAVSLITYLSSSIAQRIGQNAIQRLEYIDQLHREWGDLLVGDN